MNGRAMTIRWSILAALGCVLAATGSARAATTCVNDVDCPNTACGGDVCDYSTGQQLCKAAGSQPKGLDGWCTVTSDCKCASLGATCAYPYCTFTKPSDAPSGGGGKSGTGGATGAAGSTTAGTGGASSTGSGGAAAAGHTGSDGGSSGGCSIGGSSAPSTWIALSVLGGLVVATRRRRRTR